MEGAFTESQEDASTVPLDALESNPEFQADRKLAEDFARRVVETYGDKSVAALFLPWSAGSSAPEGTIFPTSRDGTMDLTQVRKVIEGKGTIVIGCTFQFPEEQAASTKVVEQLRKFADVCILAAHLLPPGNNYVKQNCENLMQVHQAIGRSGVDDVLLDPEWDPPRLKLRLRMAQHSWSVNQKLLESMLNEEPQPPPPEEVAALEATHNKLLWEDIPRELMPHLKSTIADLQETDGRVGDYVLERQIETQGGIVWEGKDENSRKVAVKIVLKSEVFTPGEVEGIYREFRFLAGFTKHRNIVQALDCFQGPIKIYTVMEFVGQRNLAQYLSDSPGYRMAEAEALGCFYQLASALAHCHQRDVSHRSVSLEHIVMNPEADGVHIPTLVDFRSAMVAKAGVTSVTYAGSLPCMSPEVLYGEAYLPKPADCWSVAVVLLETAGGKGSFFHSVQPYQMTRAAGEVLLYPANEPVVPVGDEINRKQVSGKIGSYFETPGNCKVALTSMGGPESTKIVEILESFLQEQMTRSTLDEFVEKPVATAAAAAAAGNGQEATAA